MTLDELKNNVVHYNHFGNLSREVMQELFAIAESTLVPVLEIDPTFEPLPEDPLPKKPKKAVKASTTEWPTL